MQVLKSRARKPLAEGRMGVSYSYGTQGVGGRTRPYTFGEGVGDHTFTASFTDDEMMKLATFFASIKTGDVAAAFDKRSSGDKLRALADMADAADKARSEDTKTVEAGHR